MADAPAGTPGSPPPDTATGTPAPLGPLERLLRVFADVRAGEGPLALLMLTNVFVVLVGYYVLKTVREPLILMSGGAEMKSYSAAGQAVLLMGFVPLYGWFASRVDRTWLVRGVTLFFMVNVELFWLGALLRVPYLGIVFFIWVGIFSLCIIAQFWSFANDLYPQDAGQRLFPLIAVGATVGSAVGSKIAGSLFALGIGAYSMLHIATLLLGVSMGLYEIVMRRAAAIRRVAPGVTATGSAPAAETEKLSREGGFGLVLRSPYLRLIALLLVVLNLVNTTGEYILDRKLLEAAATAIAAAPDLNLESYIGAFKGDYFFGVNVATVALQALLVSRLVKYGGMRAVLLALPIIALGTYGLLAAGAGLAVVRWAKTAENSMDYSVMNTARALLWLPTTRSEKYKAKQAIDTFFVRIGDLLSTALVFVGTTWLSFGVRGFASTNLCLIALWLTLAALLLREHRRLTAAVRPSS